MYLVHVAAKDIPANLGLKAAKAGFDNTLRLEIELDPSLIF